jgi:hypothetical protein
MSIKVLLVGRLDIVLEGARPTADAGFGTFAANDLAQVKAIFQDQSIEHVFMGAGLEIGDGSDLVGDRDALHS